MELERWIVDARVLLGMLLVQVIATGLQILSRVILSEGTFIFALMTYRNVVAAFSVAPFALYLERGALRKINFEVFICLFLVALTGISMAMGLFYYGLKDTTATYATNFLNLIPVVTFLLSTILRIEKLSVHTKGGKMKSAGAMLCLAGALTMALYKGKSFNLFPHNPHQILIKTNQNKTRGTFFLIGSCLSYAFWFILQGVLATAATFALISMAITQKGPTYPSMFNPLSLIFILIIEALFFAQHLSIGSLIGMVLIIAGLYSFLWGKRKDMKAVLPPPPSSQLKEIGRGGDVEETMECGSLANVPSTSPNLTSH